MSEAVLTPSTIFVPANFIGGRQSTEGDGTFCTVVDKYHGATVTDELLDAVVMMKGVVVNDFPQYDAVRAWMPLDQVEALAERADVRFIRHGDAATTNRPGVVP